MIQQLTIFYAEKYFIKRYTTVSFPGGPMVKNPPAYAGDTFDAWCGEIPHTMEQLSRCPTVTEPVL